MADEAIKESDLIQSDGTINKIIDALEELNFNYSVLIETVRKSAKDIAGSLKSVSTATEEGRKEVDMAVISANRLKKAQKELAFAMSDTGKQVAWLKEQTSAQNKLSVEQQKRAEALAGSYNKIKIQVTDLTRRWKELSEEERQGEKGDRLLSQLMNKKIQLKSLDDQLKIHVEQMSELQKAEQRLAYLQSEEGKKYIEIKKQINEVLRGRRAEKEEIDKVAQAAERLAFARSSEYAEIQKLNQETHEQQRIVKLTNQLNSSAVGSYNQLAAQYELNKIKLNAMSAEERNATGAGKELEEETLNIYKQMIKLQEATGNHRLSVGNYKLAWNGLGNAMNQVIRELPSAAMGINTFFLAISNNIPVLIDEIDKVRQRNKLAQAEGKATTSVVGTIINSIFSWQSALIVVLTALSMNGKAIMDWITKLIKGKGYVISLGEAIWDVNEEIKNSNDSFGKHTTTVKSLSNEWKNLKTTAEKTQWIKDNQSAFQTLDINIRSVSDAENAFVNNTGSILKAFELRAKAAAATALAAKEYEKALTLSNEQNTEKESYNTGESKNFLSSIANYFKAWWHYYTSADAASSLDEELRRQHLRNAEALEEEKNAAEKTGDQYSKLATQYEDLARAMLHGAGLSEYHKKTTKREKNPRQRDLTDQIWRNDLSIRKKYELSLSELQRNEFKKRRIEAVDQANQTIREMQEKFRKNQVFLTNPDKKFKPLTPEQKAQIEQQQKEIGAIIENTRRKLEIDLTNIEYEYEVDRAKKLRQAMKWRLEDIEEDVEKEKQLRLKQLEEQEQLYTTKASTEEGGEVVITGTMTPEEIAEFQRKRQQIIAEYDQIIYNMRKSDIEAQIELVKKGSEEELALLLKQNEIARQLALAENRAKPAEQRQSESQINSQFDKRGANIKASTTMTNFDEAQAAAEAEFNIVKHNETQITLFRLKAEQDRWRKLVQLAKEGALDWSSAQLEEAEAMIEKLDREINEASDFTGLVGEKGIGGALLTKLGLNDDQISAMSDATNIIIDNIKSIADAEVEAAEAAVAAAEKRVEAAQSAYDAEIEGRNNGYANSVATAKKELQQEKKNQAQKQKLLEEAQRRQQAIDSVIQASSLITASANLWSTFSKIPIVGPSLAMAAIAAMWGSFAIAKVKAAQVTKQSSEEYGEGGLEFLEGGSHASGNDIDLQTKNSKGKNMRAEGGEAMAIINKRNTRKYRKVLPQLVNSLNNGTFEDKFIGAFKTGDSLAQQISYQANEVDLSCLEENVKALKRNTERRYFTASDGSTVEIKGNVTRYIH